MSLQESYGNPSLIRPPRVYRRKEYSETANKALREGVACPVRRPCSFSPIQTSSVAPCSQERSSPLSPQLVPVHELVSNSFKEYIGSSVCISGEKRGRLRYVGLVHDRDGIFCGVELDEPVGHHDGCFAGRRYFQTAPCHAVFAPVNSVEIVLEKEADPGSRVLATGEHHPDTHVLPSSQMMESCELIEDVQPLLISSYYFEESQADQSALPVSANSTFVISSVTVEDAQMETPTAPSSLSSTFLKKSDSVEDVHMETPTAPSVDPVDGGSKKKEPKAANLNGKDKVETRSDSSAPKQVSSATNENCYQIRSKNRVDLPVVDGMPASAAPGDPIGQCGMAVFGSTAGEDASGHVSSRLVAGTPIGSEGTLSPCGSLERAQGTKSGLEKRKPDRREGSMVTNSKSAKMDSSSSRNGHLKTKNDSLNGQALSQNVPTRPPPKPSKHAEIMAKLRESIKLDKDRPKKEVKSRIGLPNPRNSIAPPTRAAEKENRYNNRTTSSQANRSAAKKNAHAPSPVEHEVAIGKQPANGMSKNCGSSRSQIADEKLSALRKQGEALKRRNSELAKGLVAFSIVIDYLNEEVIPSLRRQSGQWREMSEQCSSALAISNARVEQLTKDREELLSEQNLYVRRLQDEHNGRLKDLEATLSMKNQLQIDEMLRAHEEEMRKLRQSLETEFEKRSLKIKYGRYHSEVCQSERKFSPGIEETKLASNERFANNVKEIESLRAVLEMKTEQNRQLQSKLKDLEKEVEETEKMKARIALLEQKNDELKEALELKKMAEKRLAVRHGDLLKTCEREKENSKRLKMDKEQLQFQLQQMLMTHSAYETPIHRQCTTSLESSTTEDEGSCHGKMSQSLIQIYADCSPRHTRDRQVTVYTHEGVQKATIPEDERLAENWKRRVDCPRSRNLSGGMEALPGSEQVPAGRHRRRVRSSCEVETARSSQRLCESLTGSLSCQVSEATDTDECHSLGDQENGSPGSAERRLDHVTERPGGNCCTDSGIFVASYHSDSNDGGNKADAVAGFPDKDDKFF